MRNVVFSGIHLEVENGLPVFAECPKCGPTIASAPVGHNIILEDVLLKCQQCGGPASPLPGHYSFEMTVFPMLASAGLTRQQARRFIQKAEKAKSIEALQVASATIHPALAQAVQEARKQKDPWGSVKQLCKIAAFIGHMGWKTAGAVATATGAYFGVLESWEHYQEHTAAEADPENATASDTHGNLSDGNPRPERKPDLKPARPEDRVQKHDWRRMKDV